MENNTSNYIRPHKYILIHTILYPISYVLGILNFSIILISQYRSFFISCYIIQGLVIIFMVKMICLFKSKYDSTENIRCTLIIYIALSFISLIFVSIEYLLIFKNFNLSRCKMDKKYKIAFVCIGIIYHTYHNLSFIYECFIVVKAVKKNIQDRVQIQIAEIRHEIDKNKNETQSSEKPKKNESFVKEDTIYIIQGKFDEKSNNENNICNIKNININNNDNNNSSRRDINLNFKHLKSKELQLNNEKINTNKNLSIQLSNRSNRSSNNKEKLNFINLKPDIAHKNKIKLDIYSENNIP